MNESIKKLLDIKYPQLELPLREKIASISSIKSFKANDELLRSGQYLKSILLLTNGVVKLSTEGDEGEEFFMYYIEPGEACALSFICATRDKKSDISGIAMEDTEAILIPIEYMDELMTQYKTWYYFVLDSYRTRFRELLDVIQSVAFQSMDERLEYYLMKQKASLGANTIPFTHEQIAKDLNSSRVVISRLLKQMENKGLVKLSRSGIELLH